MTPQELEELSFRNLVEFHREDLMKIVNGAIMTSVFTEHRHGYLKKHGVLGRVPTKRYSRPTPRAMEVLNSLNSSGSKTQND